MICRRRAETSVACTPSWILRPCQLASLPPLAVHTNAHVCTCMSTGTAPRPPAHLTSRKSYKNSHGFCVLTLLLTKLPILCLLRCASKSTPMRKLVSRGMQLLINWSGVTCIFPFPLRCGCQPAPTPPESHGLCPGFFLLSVYLVLATRTTYSCRA